MTEALCQACHRPTPDAASLCPSCTATLEQHLGDIPALADELQVTLTRQARIGEAGSVSRSAVRPLPYDPRASKAADELRTVLVGWVRDIHRGDEPWPTDQLADIARWLLARADVLRMHPAAGEILGSVEAAVRAAWRAVDRPPERLYAGPCGADVHDPHCPCVCHTSDSPCPYAGGCGTVHVTRCPTDVYARPGAADVTCPTCRTRWDVRERREWLLASAEDVLAHAELIGRALAALGEDVTPAMVRGYVRRERLVAHGVDTVGRPLYRVGDVLELAHEAARRRSA